MEPSTELMGIVPFLAVDPAVSRCGLLSEPGVVPVSLFLAIENYLLLTPAVSANRWDCSNFPFVEV